MGDEWGTRDHEQGGSSRCERDAPKGGIQIGVGNGFALDQSVVEAGRHNVLYEQLSSGGQRDQTERLRVEQAGQEQSGDTCQDVASERAADGPGGASERESARKGRVLRRNRRGHRKTVP